MGINKSENPKVVVILLWIYKIWHTEVSQRSMTPIREGSMKVSVHPFVREVRDCQYIACAIWDLWANLLQLVSFLLSNCVTCDMMGFGKYRMTASWQTREMTPHKWVAANPSRIENWRKRIKGWRFLNVKTIIFPNKVEKMSILHVNDTWKAFTYTF